VQKKRKAVEKAIKTVLAVMLPAGMRYRILHHASRSHYGLCAGGGLLQLGGVPEMAARGD
jgi:hypothetical protein